MSLVTHVLWPTMKRPPCILNEAGDTRAKGERVIGRFSRRAFVSSLAALVAGPAVLLHLHSANAQQSVSPRRIGVLLVGLSPDGKEVQKLREALRDAGYAEGRDLVIEW